MKKLFFSAAALVLILSSCKKDKGNDARAISKENIIGTFKLTALSYTTNGVSSDGLKLMDDCAKDDLYIFKTGDNFEHSDAGTKCDPEGSSLSTWTLAGDTISMEGESAKVTSLTATTLETTETINESSQGQTITFTIKTTFARQ